jgi:ATPase family associated with various cellular activities (AAA)
MDDPHGENTARELAWLSAAIAARLTSFFAEAGAPGELPAPPVLDPASAYGRLVAEAGLDPAARLTLALALAPHVLPSLLDPFFVRNTAIDRPFSEFGGRAGAQTFLPTGESAVFLVAGADVAARVRAAALFQPDHPLRARGLVTLDPAPQGAPVLAGGLRIDAGLVALLTTGAAQKPDYAPDFPARRLTTGLTWDDLVLAPDVLDQVGHIAGWLEHERRIWEHWGLGRTLTPGYRALFYGPPGTGKTLTAALIGQQSGLDVYRIDLSMVVSKYIGETEKNLAGVFDQAAHRRWILFFDEADALFGARSAGGSANDRYANQEVAYLLQRIEDCPCVVILATNLKSNMDDAFLRRFQSLVGFTRPDAAQRERLWRGVLGGVVPLAPDVRIAEIARDHELVGGAIVNVARHAAVTALRCGRQAIAHADLLNGVASELRKEGRTP